MSTWSGPALPTGTLTFLFTDVEGSTRLWEAHPVAMRLAMARHDVLLTSVFEQHDGVVVRPRGEGDSLFCVFVRASDAVAAALSGQRAMQAEDWGDVGPLRVRMGLHTGEADLRDGDYYGAAVNRCARIRAAGHGGQILLSEATARLVRGNLPPESELVDLGRHRLKDLAEPELIVQLTAPDLPTALPPLVTLEARPNNLPLQLTSFIGRERELAEIAALLGTVRLLTLTGPGGTGKTRLALQAAAERLDDFADGVFFVDLAPLADATLVPSAVARVLAVQERLDLAPRERVLRFLRGRRLLLVLDNYEHLLSAAEFAGAVLQDAPNVTVLITSRAPLRLRGEREYAVPPLPLLASAGALPATLTANPAVALFVVRAQDVRADFALTETNAVAVAAICARLDGLPLAIELAAARVRALPPEALLARLQRGLPLLVGGARDAPARQQTLRDAIAWSYALLAPQEQALFRRLAVFAGGCTLELAEAVGNADGDLGLDVLDGISSLVEKSLLRESEGIEGEPRYRMLETIREFALEQLAASGEAEAVRRQFAVQALQLARQSTAASNWTRLDADADNARAVLGWCVERAELGIGVRLWWALRFYFVNRGRDRELAAWRQRLLALPEATQPGISRARLLAQPPLFRFSAAEQMLATAELAEAIRVSRQLGDNTSLAVALQNLAFLHLDQGNYDAAVPLAEEALVRHLAAGTHVQASLVRSYLARAALARGDIATAERLVAANRAQASAEGITRSLSSEAELAEAHGDDATARRLLEEFVRREGVEAGDSSPNRLLGLLRLARVMLRQGDMHTALATCAVCLAMLRSEGPSRILPVVLSLLAQAAEQAGQLTSSARLLAAADAQRREFTFAVPLRYQADQQALVARVRVALDASTFNDAWAASEALSPEEAIEFGLAVVAQLQQSLAAKGESTRRS